MTSVPDKPRAVVLLSGGLDSSLVVGLLARQGQSNLNTFSIGFESVGGETGDDRQQHAGRRRVRCP